ncbi:MAG: arylsulfatase B, partial [Pseudohongiellaceae bacterium]
YITTDMVDWFLSWQSQQQRPWLAVLSFNAPHSPWHTPPQGLYSTDLTMAAPVDVDPRPYYKADLEALDYELGRALSGLGADLENTIVIFLGDNGTPFPVPVPPFDPMKAKTKMYEGGVHVPMIVTGPQVGQPGQKSTALVNVTDVFATVAEWAGVDLASALPAGTQLDSVSFAPFVTNPQLPSAREVLYSEVFSPNGLAPYANWKQAIRNDRYKVIRFGPKSEEFYDLLADPFEDADLLQGVLNHTQLMEYEQLILALDKLTQDFERPALSGQAGLSGPTPQPLDAPPKD